MRVSRTKRAALAATMLGALTISLSSSALASTTPAQPLALVRAGSSRVVYLVTSNCKYPQCRVLYRTTIAATHFARRMLPDVARGGPASTSELGSLEFANPRDGFLTIPNATHTELFATTNGARSWRHVETVKGRMFLTVTSTQVFTSTNYCQRPTEFCYRTVIRRAGLGLKSWTRLPMLWPAYLKSNNDPEYGPSLGVFGPHVFELEPSIARWWSSANDGRTFDSTSLKWPQLVSVAGCQLTAITSEQLWAECPTGMQVSFWHSSNGGRRWTPISQTQFFGTGGGWFAPISPSEAYLYYGPVQKGRNVLRLSDDGAVATPVGSLMCDTQTTPVFSSANDGLVGCNVNSTSYFLVRTSDGGQSWQRIKLPPSTLKGK